jgi:hypothetical protein
MSSADVLRRLLSDRPIAFHPTLARAFGGIHEAVFFQQIANWSDKGDDLTWISTSQMELEAETCLSSDQQRQALDCLKRLGVLQDERHGMPPLLSYHIVWEAVFTLLDTAHLDADEPSSKDAYSPPTASERTQRMRPVRSLTSPKGPRRVNKYDEDREILATSITEIAREFADQSPISSSVTRVHNLHLQTQLSLAAFIAVVDQARRLTQERCGAAGEPIEARGRQQCMAAFFSVLEGLLGDLGHDLWPTGTDGA